MRLAGFVLAVTALVPGVLRAAEGGGLRCHTDSAGLPVRIASGKRVWLNSPVYLAVRNELTGVTGGVAVRSHWSASNAGLRWDLAFDARNPERRWGLCCPADFANTPPVAGGRLDRGGSCDRARAGRRSPGRRAYLLSRWGAIPRGRFPGRRDCHNTGDPPPNGLGAGCQTAQSPLVPEEPRLKNSPAVSTPLLSLSRRWKRFTLPCHSPRWIIPSRFESIA